MRYKFDRQENHHIMSSGFERGTQQRNFEVLNDCMKVLLKKGKKRKEKKKKKKERKSSTMYNYKKEQSSPP